MQGLLLDLVFSVSRVILGVLGAFVLALLIAFVRSSLSFKIKENFLVGFFFDVLRFLPPIAWIPFVILYNGVGGSSSLVLVVLGAFPPMMLALYEGLENIKTKHSVFVRTLQLDFATSFRRIYLPAMIPQIFLSVRLGIGMGWISIIAAEMVAGDRGMGYSLQLFRFNLEVNLMALYLIVIGLAGYSLSESIKVIEKKLFPWEKS